MRAICAETLLEKVEKIQPWDAYLGKYAQGIRHCMELVSLLIQDAPTIEPETEEEAYERGYTKGQMAQRKKGKWIFDDGLKQFFCDKCAEPSLTADDVYIYSMDLPNYCPNCGADMRGEKNERID